MNDAVNFDHPEEYGLYPNDSNKIETSGNLQHHFDTAPLPVYPVQPCPSCGHCPTCGRGSGFTYYGPWWGYNPHIPFYWGTTSTGIETTTKLGPLS